MIRVPYEDGFLLIPQAAHALVSGQLARHWGGALADAPEPHEAVVIGTTLHDVGWLQMDRYPILNEMGQPLNFLEASLDDVEDMYLRAVDDVVTMDPYAGLLVNRHIDLIFDGRIRRGADSHQRLQPALDNLRDQRERLVARMRQHPRYANDVDERKIEHNYRILRVCDLLSLFVCGAIPARPIPETPTRYGVAKATAECKLGDSDILHLSLPLFDQTEITFFVDARYVKPQRFDSLGEYKTAFDNAPIVTLRKTIVVDESLSDGDG